MSIEVAITQLQDGLEKLASEGHPEFTDSAVRELLREHMDKGLTQAVDYYHVKKDLKMFTKEGDVQLQAVLLEFLNDPAIVSARKKGTAYSDVEDVVNAMGIDPFKFKLTDREEYLFTLGFLY